MEKIINKVNVILVSDDYYEPKESTALLFFNNKIMSSDKSFPISEIDSIELSMCSIASSIKLQVLYFVDLNITINQEKYYFQIMNSSVVLDVINWIKKRHIKYSDVLGIENIFNQYPEELQRWKYINRHFHTWAKQYKLDNPRDNYYENYYNELKETINDVIETYKKKK